MHILDRVGRWLAAYLAKPRPSSQVATTRPELLLATLEKGDVLLVEGSSRFSTAIKYLTQSSWSHAAIFVGDDAVANTASGEPHVLIDVDALEGIRSVPLSEFSHNHTRICRPVGLSEREIDSVVAYCVGRLGQQYDMRNIVDLARYLIQTPPVGVARRRRMLAFASGDPTRAICSTLVAQAFHSVRYPILPDVVHKNSNDPNCKACTEELLHIRNYSLFTPRDFDVSPYFGIIKPNIAKGFDPHTLQWGDGKAESS